MATNTEHYNLKKPDPEDFADIADINGNMDIIDETLANKADLTPQGTIPEEQLPDLGYIPASEKGASGGVASLDNTGKVPSGQLPAMDYIGTNQRGAANGVASLDDTGKVPSGQLPSMDYVPTSQKGAANGVATLGNTGKIPTNQIPSLGYIPTNEKGAANGVATLDAGGKIPASQVGAVGVPPRLTVTIDSGSTVTCRKGSTTFTATSTGAAVFDLDDYGTWNVTATKNGQTASGSVTVDDVKLYSLALEYFSATLRVNSEEGATVSVTGPKSFSAVVPSGGQVSFTVDAAGTYSVTATKGSETTDPVTAAITTGGQTYTVDCLFFNSTFANNTWAQVAKATAAGKAKTLWSVGDTKDITLSTGEVLTVEILDFDHDDLADGSGKAGITFGLKNLMAQTRRMNASDTNVGGYTGSEKYNWLTNTLFGQLPADLQPHIKSVNKKTSAGNKSTTINTNAMTLFEFAEIEIFGTTTYSAAGEGTQYAGFATASRRTKYLANGTGAVYYWFERSPYASNANVFCSVYSSGSANVDDASYTRGVCFGFCI